MKAGEDLAKVLEELVSAYDADRPMLGKWQVIREEFGFTHDNTCKLLKFELKTQDRLGHYPAVMDRMATEAAAAGLHMCPCGELHTTAPDCTPGEDHG